MATKKKATKKAAIERTAQRDAGDDSGSPITIGGGSMFIHYHRNDFNHHGDTDDHKKSAATVSHLFIAGDDLGGKTIDIDITKPITIVVYYK
jgi:hypothetical protein